MDTPPPPPPHGGVPRSSGLPPGKYDIFVIPEHSAGSGFLYLPSLQPNVNSFAAGFASALILVALSQSMAPAFRAWWDSFQGMGNMGITLLILGVGFGAWALGRTQNGSSSSSSRGQDSSGGHSRRGPFTSSTGTSHNADAPPPPPPHGNAHGGAPPPPPPHSSPGGPPPGSHSRASEPPPHAYPPPPPRPPTPEATPPPRPPPPPPPPREPTPPPPPPPPPEPEKPKEQPPPPPPEPKKPKEQPPPPPPEPEKPKEQPPPPKPQAEKPKPQASKGSWEKAREETRKREEERKAKEAEQKRREDAARRLAELRAKDAKERAEREKERQRKEKEAQDRKERLEAEQKAQELAKTLAERLAKEVKERERLEKEAREAREREEARRKEALEAKRREEEKKKKEEEEKAKAAQSSRGTSYAYSSVGEKTSMWPNGRPPVPPSVAPSAAPSSAPSAARSAAGSSASQNTASTKKPPAPSAKTYMSADDDGYSFRPYDKKPRNKPSLTSLNSESSWAPSQTTARTSPPGSMRGPYTTNDPDKIVIQAVYLFMNQFSKTPASQLMSGVGAVTDGLILRITTEGLFIDDDVRGVPQREWDVKAWTLKLVEVWCPPHCLNASASAPSGPPPSMFQKATGSRDRNASKPFTGEDADAYLAQMLNACKDCCRLGLCNTTFKGTNLPSSHGQTGEWKDKGLHVLRATIRDQEGKRYVVVLDESEGWKVAAGLQRLRRGTQVRQLGVSSMPPAEARGTLDMLGWGA
jgi:hypothetical protein